MKLSEIKQPEIIWEGDIEGHNIVFLIEQQVTGSGFKGIFQTMQRSSKGGFLKKIGDLAKHPISIGAMVGIAQQAYTNYKKNKRMTTTFFAQTHEERKFYDQLVNDLMKTGHYKKVKQQYVEGGMLWELKRVS